MFRIHEQKKIEHRIARRSSNLDISSPDDYQPNKDKESYFCERRL